jgi:glycosyltransferase involved in cell wall biosynthesis
MHPYSRPSTIRRDQMTEQGSVAIIIPTKDRPDGLRLAVASALDALPEQSSALIVIDDASSPAASDTLRDITDPRLQVVRNPGPHGPAAARNLGARIADAEVLFFLDDDDILLKDYIDRIMAARKKDAALATYGFSNAIVHHRIKKKQKHQGILDDNVPLSARLSAVCMGFWIVKSKLIEVGGIDESLVVNEDTDLGLRLVSNGAIGWFSQDPGVQLHSIAATQSRDMPSITSTSRASVRAEAFQSMLDNHSGLLARHPAMRRHFIRRIIKYRTRASDAAGARNAASLEPNVFWRCCLRTEAAARNTGLRISSIFRRN